MAKVGIWKESSQHIGLGLTKEKETAYGKGDCLLRDLLLFINVGLSELDCAVRAKVREIFNDSRDNFLSSTPRSPDINDDDLWI